MMELLLPIRTESESNLRGHWAKRFRRANKQRQTARLLVQAGLRRQSSPESCLVTLTRIAPRRLDSDNLAASLKAVRDGVADALSIDDGDPRIEWRYAQKKGKSGEYAVSVEV